MQSSALTRNMLVRKLGLGEVSDESEQAHFGVQSGFAAEAAHQRGNAAEPTGHGERPAVQV